MNRYLIGLTKDAIMGLLPEDQFRHSIHVKMLVEKLTDWLSIPETAANCTERGFGDYSMAAYYHDIGKVFIPPDILSKPDKLTPEEYRMIQRHTIFAQDLFSFSGVLDGITSSQAALLRDAAVYHHEWWNGKGYSFGLKKEEIPYIARVTSICDAYDAMVSDRAYRRPYTHGYACEELKKGAGTQFEPALVKVFLAHEGEVLKMYCHPRVPQERQLRKAIEEKSSLIEQRATLCKSGGAKSRA